MSNPPMPSLDGQIFETIKANLKLIIIFTCLITAMEIICGGTLIQHIDLIMNTDKSHIFYLLLLALTWSYIYPMTKVIAINYHQQPPHAPRRAMWLSDIGFHAQYLPFCLHLFYITALTFCISLLWFIPIAITITSQSMSVVLIMCLLYFVTIIFLTIYVATKLPAVMDPNGNASFKASFKRGKQIFWKYLGHSLVTILGISLIASLILHISVNILVEIRLLPENLPKDMLLTLEKVGIISFSTINFIKNFTTLISTLTFGVIASHYYIWSEYYLPKEEEEEQ